MKKILVTGGAGFIGSHLCEELIKNPGYEIWSLDNYSSGSKSNHIEGVKYIKGSTLDIKKYISFSPDLVFHLGEYSRVEKSFDDVDFVWRNNMIGTYEVVKFCHENNAKLVYSGSSTKFADNGSGASQSPYAWTKSTNTNLIVNYSNWYGLTFAIVYFYNAYGNREISTGKYATLIGIFKTLYKEGKKLPVVLPGNQRRNFTHVKDIVSGLILVGEKGKGDNYGIGVKESFSVLEIANFFGGEVEFLPERKGNRQNAEVVSNKTIDLGWKPLRSVKDYIDDFKNTLKKT